MMEFSKTNCKRGKLGILQKQIWKMRSTD